MKELREEQELLGDSQMTDNEILTTTLGHRSGYARGQDYRAEPSKKKDHSSQASIDQMRLELEQDFDKKLQEEQQKYEEKLAAIEQKMEERFASLMEKMQTNAS